MRLDVNYSRLETIDTPWIMNILHMQMCFGPHIVILVTILGYVIGFSRCCLIVKPLLRTEMGLILLSHPFLFTRNTFFHPMLRHNQYPVKKNDFRSSYKKTLSTKLPHSRYSLPHY